MKLAQLLSKPPGGIPYPKLTIEQKRAVDVFYGRKLHVNEMKLTAVYFFDETGKCISGA